MKRDDDLIRRLLLEMEQEDDEWLFLVPGNTSDSTVVERRERYHYFLCIDEGLIANVGNDTVRLTAAGHDFLDAVRDDDAWKKVKSFASRAGGASLGLLRDLAIAVVRQKMSEITGIRL